MGFGKLNEVVEKLTASGLRARRGYPVEGMPDLVSTVAAVHLASLTPEQTQVEVRVITPLGGSACETGAEMAVAALESMGAAYIVGPCTFDGESRYFTCCVTGTWNTGLNCSVKVGDQLLQYLVAVSAKRSISHSKSTDSESGYMTERYTDMGWSITLEEMLPAQTMPEVDTSEEFSVHIYRPDGNEVYQNCKWVQISLENTAQGIRRVRVARTWEERTISE